MRWCSYDAEGDAGSRGLLGVSIVSDIEQRYYTDKSKILNRLLYYAYKGYTFISHNAEYDIPVVFWQLHQDVQCRYYNNKFNRGIWLFDKEEKTAQIWDSLGLSGQVSLLRLGKAIHLPKYATPLSLGGTITRDVGWICDKHGYEECIECYAVRDAEIVYEFMQSYTKFLSEYNIPPKRTIGSAAVAIWKAIEKPSKCQLPIPSVANGHINHGKHVLQQCNCDACIITTMSRESYYGGRVDAFKWGYINGGYCGDVTSMYPYVMKNKPMPDSESIIVNRKGGTTDIIDRFEGISECTVNVPYMYVPPLPVSYDGKLVFGYGTLRGTWCHIELRSAIQLGITVTQIHKQLYTVNTVYPFSEYVSTLMQLRQQYKLQLDAREQTVKILLNSLYGRIGIRENQVEKTLFPLPKDKTHLDFPHSTLMRTPSGPQIEVEKHHFRQNPYSNVMWASHITAYARVHLLNYLIQQGDSLLYSDTDSIFSDRPILGLGVGLGELADNGQYDTVHIVGPKLYSLESTDKKGIYRAKGVPARFAKEFLLNGQIEFDAPFKPREAARRGKIAGMWDARPRTRRLELTKRIIVDNDAYKVRKSYSDTEPIHITME